MRLSLLASHSGLCVLSLLLLTGCDPIIRTYGSHGNVEAHKVQMALAVENFEASLARNRADLIRLTQAAAGNPALAPAAERMANLVALQEAVVLGHRNKLAELADEGDYRNLNRALGAMISEHQVIADRYADILGGLSSDPVASYPESITERARYVFVPPQYYRVNNRVRAQGLDGIASPAPPNANPSVVSDSAAVAPVATPDSAAAEGNRP